MEELRQKFEQETKQGRYNTEGAEPEENNGSFNDAYVEWLEEQVSKLPIHGVSKCACSPLVACEICGEEKNLDGDFWKNKKKHDC